MRAHRICWLGMLLCVGPLAADEPVPFPGTQPLKMEGDIASQLVDGADRFLLRQLEQSIAARAAYWKRNFDSPEAYEQSIAPQRKRLAHILGLRDAREPLRQLELVGTTSQSSLLGRSDRFRAFTVRWPTIGDMHGVGLLLVPRGTPVADVVAIPDADQSPEQIAGLVEGDSALEPEHQFARRLAEQGCRVLIPMLIDRRLEARNGRAQLSSREFLYRSAYELGRHLIGYELHQILAGVDYFHGDGDAHPIGVVGWGEGGMLALYAGALDPRIDATCVSGYFDSRQRIWETPLDRNVFGLLEQFGDAEIASMIATRSLIVEAAKAPELTLPSKGGGPATLTTPELSSVKDEFARAEKLIAPLAKKGAWKLIVRGDGSGPPLGSETLGAFFAQLKPGAELKPVAEDPERVGPPRDNAARHARQVHEIDRHNQWLLRESPFVRREYMKNLKTDSLASFQASQKAYRDAFRHDVIGHFDLPLGSPQPRSRRAYDNPKWTGYEVVLDVFPDVFAYGILIMPKDIKPGERRPVVVCQHGLEGRPQDIVQGDHRAYHDFATKLAERGFITFAPQNLYIFRDRFRTLQRKANPLKKTLFSLIVPQHQQITNWLAGLPQVDPERIGFYGLSYGGKSAMRIPPLVDRYCLSICSADFNEWVLKNASTRHNFSYVWTGEYEIFEWDLGSTFNYSEMAALICPRPFMVERGHYDGVAEDEWVGYEFAKVRHLYAARLGIPDRCEIEWFYGQYKGIHTINGQGSYDFLHKHLKWPKPKSP